MYDHSYRGTTAARRTCMVGTDGGPGSGGAGQPPGSPAAHAPRQLDRRSPLPLWAQLRADLRRRLDAGAFDDEFPGELALVADYGVSRHTVRSAPTRLPAELAAVPGSTASSGVSSH